MRTFRHIALAAAIFACVPVITAGCAAKDGIRALWTLRSDESVLREIKHKFKDAGPEFLALEVRVKNQKVTLKGVMRTQEQKQEAERLAWEVSGVDSVFVDVQVNK